MPTNRVAETGDVERGATRRGARTRRQLLVDGAWKHLSESRVASDGFVPVRLALVRPRPAVALAGHGPQQ
eukprot:838896-Pyramimonas_sp.AAC.1